MILTYFRKHSHGSGRELGRPSLRGAGKAGALQLINHARYSNTSVPASTRHHLTISPHLPISSPVMGGDTHRTVPKVSNDYPQLAEGPVGKQIHSIYQSRLRQFTDGGQYREQGLLPYVHI